MVAPWRTVAGNRSELATLGGMLPWLAMGRDGCRRRGLVHCVPARPWSHARAAPALWLWRVESRADAAGRGSSWPSGAGGAGHGETLGPSAVTLHTWLQIVSAR